MNIHALLTRSYYGNGPRAWLVAAITFAVCLVVLLIARKVLLARFTKLAGRTQNDVDDFVVKLVRRTHPLFLLVLSAAVASLTLSFEAVGHGRIRALVVAGLILQSVFWGSDLIVYLAHKYKQTEGDKAGKGTITAMIFMGRLVLWVVLVLLLLDNFGIHISTLVATLGVGGIAVALAAQSVLGDLLAAISIYFDQPVVIGDFVVLGDYAGTVESVGLRSTRLASLSGERVVMPNSDLLKSRIRNYRDLTERRVVFTVSVAYGTAYESVAAVPGIIREAIESQDLLRFDRAHFKEFGESAMHFEAVYYVLSGDYAGYMDRQQAINLRILQRFEEMGITFGHPVRRLAIVGSDVRGLMAPTVTSELVSEEEGKSRLG